MSLSSASASVSSPAHSVRSHSPSSPSTSASDTDSDSDRIEVDVDEYMSDPYLLDVDVDVLEGASNYYGVDDDDEDEDEDNDDEDDDDEDDDLCSSDPTESPSAVPSVSIPSLFVLASDDVTTNAER